MKVTCYVREKDLEKLNQIVEGRAVANTELPLDFITTSEAQRMHFHGWIEVIIPYNKYVEILDSLKGVNEV